MGAQLKGNIQDLSQCIALQDVYAKKYLQYISNQLDLVVRSPPQRDRTFGVELELVGVDQAYQLRAFDGSQYGKNYVPESLTANVEVVSDPTTHSSIQEYVAYLDQLVAGVQGSALQVGTYPLFNKQLAQQFQNPRERYQLIDRMFAGQARDFCIGLENGLQYCGNGASWSGIGTSFQFTVNTPLNEVRDFYNAAKKLGPIALYASASSPFIDGLLTNKQSVRSIVYPMRSMSPLDTVKSKWRSLDALTDNFQARNGFEQHAYAMLAKHDSAVAKYFVESMREGWVLRELGDEENVVQPPPTFWPTVKLQGHLINDRGVPIEIRTAEQLANTIDTVHYMLGMHSMIMQEALLQRCGVSQTTTGVRDDANVQSVNNTGLLQWNGQRVHAQEVVRRFVPGMINLSELGYSQADIKSVQAWWANRVNDAQVMREHALRVQPNLSDGKRLSQDTLEQILFRHKVK